IYYDIITLPTVNMYTSTIFDQTARTRAGPLAYFNSTSPLVGIPSRNDIVAEFDNGMTTILQQSLSGKQPIHFMPTEVSDDTKYVNGLSTYILRIAVPEEMPLSMFKTKLGLTPEPYLYKTPEPGEHFEYVVVENDSSQKVGEKMEFPEVARRLDKKIDINYYLKSVVRLCAQFINYDDRHQPSFEIVLEALKKLKDGVSKGFDNEADEDDVDEDEVDED
ncbi:14518_t:CDS:2, partial [Gigaspora margarita]